MSDRKDEPSVYTIPPNYKESGSLFGGTLKMRNAIEAGLLAFIISFFLLKTGLSLYGKIIALCLTALPVGLFALIGINGESLFSFVMSFFVFVKKRRYVQNASVATSVIGVSYKGANVLAAFFVYRMTSATRYLS